MPLDRTTGVILHFDAEAGDVVDRSPDITVEDFNQVVVWNAAAEIYCHPDDVEAVLRLDFPPSDRPLLESHGSPFPDLVTDGVNAAPVRRKHRRS